MQEKTTYPVGTVLWRMIGRRQNSEIRWYALKFEASYREIAEEAADTITAITSMLEAMGIDENMRQDAQKQANEKNKERGRF